MHSAIKSQPFTPSRRNSKRTQLRQLLTKVFLLEPFWLLLVAIPVSLPGLLPQSFQPFGVMALLLFWPLRWWSGQIHRQQPFGSSALILLVSWLPVNLLVATATDEAWQALGYLLLGVALYVMLINQPWLKIRPLSLGQLMLMMGVGIISLAPIVQWKSTFRLFYVPIYDWFQQIPINVGETIHANILAGALLQLAILSIALALPPLQKELHLVTEDEERSRYIRIKRHRWEHFQQWTALLIAALLTGLLVLTQSRGAYLGMAAAFLMLSIMRWPRLIWTLPIVGLGIGIMIYQYGIYSTFDLLGADNTFGGAEWRTGIWHAAGQALHDFPYSGIGIGNFRTVLPLLYPHPVLDSDSAQHAHNLMMQIGLDLGLPGLTAYLLFILTTFWIGIRRIRERTYCADAQPRFPHETSRQRRRRLVHQARRHNEAWALTAGAVAALIGIQVHGLLDAVTWGTKFAFLPWLICALIWLTATRSHTYEEQR